MEGKDREVFQMFTFIGEVLNVIRPVLAAGGAAADAGPGGV